MSAPSAPKLEITGAANALSRELRADDVAAGLVNVAGPVGSLLHADARTTPMTA
jgi:hypothetical protein